MSIQRVKQRVYYMRRMVGSGRLQLCRLCHFQVWPGSLYSCCFTRFPSPSCFNRLLKSQCGSVLLFFGCLLRIQSDCVGMWDCYCADVAILEVPLYNLVNFCYTFASPPQGERSGRIKLFLLATRSHEE